MACFLNFGREYVTKEGQARLRYTDNIHIWTDIFISFIGVFQNKKIKLLSVINRKEHKNGTLWQMDQIQLSTFYQISAAVQKVYQDN